MLFPRENGEVTYINSGKRGFVLGVDMGQFNVIEEPWITCVYKDGHSDEVSLMTLFRDAPEIREITGDIPQQVLPILRLLLAILYRAYYAEGLDHEQMRTEWKRIWDANRFDMELIENYLENFHDRFNLLDDEHPFYQTAGLEYVGDKKPYDPVGEMIADVPKPDKYLFSMCSQHALEQIPFAKAARWLVFLQGYDTAGIKTPVVGNSHVNKGKVYAPKNIVGTGWLGAIGGIYVERDSLFKTLMLNWCMYDPTSDAPLFGNERDRPAWEKEDSTTDLTIRERFTGPVEALTWQSRKVRLVPNADQSAIIGLISCYGDMIAQFDKDCAEKMSAWRGSAAQRKKLGLSTLPYMPQMHDASKALWRGLAPILQSDGDRDGRPGVIRWVEELRHHNCLGHSEHLMNAVTIHVQGMTYGTQNSVFETGIDDSLCLPIAMLRHDSKAVGHVMEVVSCAEDAVNALAEYVVNLQIAAGSQASKASVQAYKNTVREAAYARLDLLFRDRLAGFTEDKEVTAYSNAWKNEIHRILLTISDEYAGQSQVSAFQEHESRGMVMSAARALSMFRGRLNSVLGSLSTEVRNAQKGEQGVES